MIPICEHKPTSLRLPVSNPGRNCNEQKTTPIFRFLFYLHCRDAQHCLRATAVRVVHKCKRTHKPVIHPES
jgi:hypothetical protein